MSRDATGWRRGGRALLAAVVAHAAIGGVVAWRLADAPDRTTARDPEPSGAAPTDVVPAAYVEILDRVPGAPVTAVPGPGDEAAISGEHPHPRADVDMPGRAGAGAGGGAAGGSESWTGRSDEHDIQAQIWSSPERNRLAREHTGDTVQSPEAVARAPRRGFDDRSERRRRARDGEARGRPGLDEGAPVGGAAAPAPSDRWDEADPWFDTAARRRDQHIDGTTRARPAAALVDRGPPATDTHRKGRAVDDRSTASASDATDPLAFEMTTPRAGGDRDGVAGPRAADGVSARSRRRGPHTAATSADVPRGPGRTSVRAIRSNPYFRRMYRRIDERVEYPRELARRLEQGEVLVTFRLLADGRVTQVRVAKSSGFDAFDNEVTTALRQAAPYGRVPAALLGDEGALRVRAPYTFRNPLIR